MNTQLCVSFFKALYFSIVDIFFLNCKSLIIQMNTHFYFNNHNQMKKLALLFICLVPFIAKAHIGVIENPDYRIKNGQEVIAIHNISQENSLDSLSYRKSREIPASIQKRLEEEIKKTEVKETADFDSDAFFCNEPARLVGFIRGYISDTIKTHTMYTQMISGNIIPLTLKLHPDGYFEADIHLEHPKMLSFSL